jgi:hypothetical protein
MAARSPARRRLLGGYGSLAVLVLGWAVALYPRTHHWLWRLHEGVEDAIYRILSGFPGPQEMAHRLFETVYDTANATFVLSLGAATLAMPLAFVARMIARARARAGHADPLDRLRDRMTRPGWSAAILAAFPVASQVFILSLGWHPSWSPLYYLISAVAGVLAQVALMRGAMRDFLAPTIATRESGASVEIGADEIRFNAVAVTREARAAVGAVAVVSLLVIAYLLSLPILSLFKDPHVFAVVGAYIAFTAASALLFRGASKISVGVDGIYVGGTSRARFFAYRDLDEVRMNSGDVELVRRGNVALRLQLHGEDATRRDAIVARIQEGLDRVKHVERDAAANFVTSRSADNVARSVKGGGDYRMPSVSHDALWTLVEGAAVDATTRTAAAEALVRTGDGTERERLRVAAAHCADPRIRVVLEELADSEAHEGDGADVPPRRAMV